MAKREPIQKQKVKSTTRKTKSIEFNLDPGLNPIAEVIPERDPRKVIAGVVWKEETPGYYWTASIDKVTLHIERVMSTASDRGDWKVLAESRHWKHSIDESDFFPRYYFDWDRMILELQEWINRRSLKQRKNEKLEPPKLTIEDKGLRL